MSAARLAPCRTTRGSHDEEDSDYEKVADECLGILRRHGYEVDVRAPSLPRRARRAHRALRCASIVRSATKVDKAVRHRVQRAELERHLAAEHTMALLLSPPLATFPGERLHARGPVAPSPTSWAASCFGKTLAIFGLGRIGGLCRRTRAGVRHERLIGCDPYCSPDRADQLGVKLYETTEGYHRRGRFHHGSPA